MLLVDCKYFYFSQHMEFHDLNNQHRPKQKRAHANSFPATSRADNSHAGRSIKSPVKVEEDIAEQSGFKRVRMSPQVPKRERIGKYMNALALCLPMFRLQT